MISGPTCTPPILFPKSATTFVQSNAYIVAPTVYRWLAEPSRIREPGGTTTPSNISHTMSANSSKVPPSILTTGTQLPGPPPDKLAINAWSVTQIQIGFSPWISLCSISQVIHVRTAGSNEEHRFWWASFPPFCTLDPTKHPLIPSLFASNEPNFLHSVSNLHPNVGTAEVSIATPFMFASLTDLHCA